MASIVEKALELLDAAPLIARILAVMFSASLAGALTLGVLEPLAASIILASAYLAWRVWRPPIPSLLARREKYAEAQPAAALIEVKLPRGDWQAASSLARLIQSRSRQSGSHYVVVTLLHRGYTRLLIAVVNKSQEMLHVDFEVLKSLIAASVEGARVKLLPEQEARAASGLLSTLADSLSVAGEAPPLTAPPEESSVSSRGSIKLGVRIDLPLPEPFSLSIGDLRGHVGVFGSTGSGKSTTLSVLACQSLRAGVKPLVLDWSGEYSVLLGRAGCRARVLNPFKDARVNPLGDSWDSSVKADIIGSALGLTEPQHYMLLRVLESSEPRDFESLVAAIEALGEESRWDREVKRGLLRKVGVFALTPGRSLVGGQTLDLGGSGPTVIDASVIENTFLRRSYLVLLATHLYRRALDGELGEVLLIVDEAHNLFGGEDGVLESLFAESRKHGLYVAAATQNPSLIPVRIVANTNTKIVHSIRGWRDLEAVSATLSLPRDIASRLPYLEPGEALVSTPSLDSPVLVKISL
ncbi:MAG: DUF87 domain-containing protein [Aeropyrum sp.]|nr:DUF87 domain-containing protein [Aeropyrum sp.]